MLKFDITGMSCAACSNTIEKAVAKIKGVSNVYVDLITNSMTVDGTAKTDKIISAVEKAGYGASLQGNKKGNGTSSSKSELRLMIIRLIMSVLFLLPLLYISMGHMMFNWPLISSLEHNYIAQGLLELLLTSIIMVINQKFYIRGFKGIIHGSPNMDTLVAVGSGAAFIYSTVILFLMTSGTDIEKYHDEMYFESAAMILTLVTVGKLLELYSRGKSTNAINSLIQLVPNTATVIRDNEEIKIETSELNKGDIVVVKAGESFPCDGVILEGYCAADESALTGESMPVDKTVGDNVFTATINTNGYLKLKATNTGQDTSFASIIKMVSDASSTKAPIARIADKVSGVFVPAVIIIALITFVCWIISGQNIGFSLARAISVIVISCPCALGLATPVAIVVGNGKGAKNNILFKNAESLENTGKAQIICFDKTGTVTKGKPSVTDVVSNDKEKLLKVAFALESKSSHPISNAIVSYCTENNIKQDNIEDFEEKPGNGIVGNLKNHKATAGNYSFISTFVEIPDSFEKKAEEFSNQGKTPIFFSCNNEFIGVIAIADKIKENSANAISMLKKLGQTIVMITGDNTKVAHSIAGELGISNVISDVLPNEKEQKVAKLSQLGKVAMVGDGINDAPALTRADTGIAVGAGTDIAIESADVVLMRDNLEDVARAVILSKKVYRNIKENLFWALFYNIICIPIAAGILYPAFGITLNPMIAAAAMSLSSICVVLNALRLNTVNLNKYVSVRKNKNNLDISYIINNDAEKDGENKKHIIIDGMMCSNCEEHIRKALLEIGLEVLPDHTQGKAIILKGKINEKKIKKAIKNAGYKYKGIK